MRWPPCCQLEREELAARWGLELANRAYNAVLQRLLSRYCNFGPRGCLPGPTL